MVTGFKQICIGVPDLERSAAELQILLGAPCKPGSSGGSRRRLALANTVLELEQCDTDQARITGLVLSSPAVGAQSQRIDNDRGLRLQLASGAESEDFQCPDERAVADELSVDHLVLRTRDADACVELFGERLGIRLALDRTVPEWGGRMLFFRSGGMTLEVIASPDFDQQDCFWGIAYQTPDIDRAWQRMTRAGVELSAVRAGRKPGTRVATISSHHSGIPALLVGPL
jgi:catechol 2,3-dioxygenase-like lactoylglutathione lyase family enzyme